MRRPTYIYILGHKVDILPMGDQADENINGYCDWEHNKIYLRSTLADSVWDGVLLHEATHYIDESSDLGLDERDISAISNGFFTAGVRLGGDVK